PGVTVPVAGQVPVEEIDGEQYLGTVVWSQPMRPDGSFAPGVAYSATITLTAKAGYTFTGTGTDSFTVAGATAGSVHNPAGTTDTLAVTAAFPATAATVTQLAIPGLTAPATGEAPAVSLPETDEYTATVSWSPEVGEAGFAPGTPYSATLELLPKAGYTFIGVAQNSFTLPGAFATSVSNDADSGTVTADFAPTALLPVTLADIFGITPPLTAATPPDTITPSAQYSGSISWSPAILPEGGFAPATSYSAIITLVPEPGYTFFGVPENFFKVAGALGVFNIADSGTVMALFAATEPLPADKSQLQEALTGAEALSRGYATEASWQALQTLITLARGVLANPAATQDDVDSATAALKAALAALRYDYPVLNPFSVWAGSGSDSVRIDAEATRFVRLRLGLQGDEVSAENYTVKSGSTILTLHEEYLKTFAPGSYDFYAEFSDGSAGPLSITVLDSGAGAGSSSGSTPATGDRLGMSFAFAAVLLVSGTALLVARRLVARKETSRRAAHRR
ncbi:MAG: FIVAR domain-containing protein, partial [Coriobacteriales bacterium]|nr:FIVAR domain-containing protein [Coriobacteriales bacterium]